MRACVTTGLPETQLLTCDSCHLPITEGLVHLPITCHGIFHTACCPACSAGVRVISVREQIRQTARTAALRRWERVRESRRLNRSAGVTARRGLQTSQGAGCPQLHSAPDPFSNGSGPFGHLGSTVLRLRAASDCALWPGATALGASLGGPGGSAA